MPEEEEEDKGVFEKIEEEERRQYEAETEGNASAADFDEWRYSPYRGSEDEEEDE